MNSFIKYLLFLTILLVPLSQALAETRYVTDQLVVTVRSQKGDQYNVLESLLSDTPVEILSEDKTYVKVKTAKGTEGFILKQYITKKYPKSLQVKNLQSKVDSLTQTLEQLRQDSAQALNSAGQQKDLIEKLTSQLSQSQQELDKKTKAYQQLLKDSDNVLNLTTENEQLIEQNNLLNSELAVLREENQSFHRTNMIQWFLAGAGVFFGGWLIGKISRRKQRGFSSM